MYNTGCPGCLCFNCNNDKCLLIKNKEFNIGKMDEIEKKLLILEALKRIEETIKLKNKRRNNELIDRITELEKLNKGLKKELIELKKRNKKLEEYNNIKNRLEKAEKILNDFINNEYDNALGILNYDISKYFKEREK